MSSNGLENQIQQNNPIHEIINLSLKFIDLKSKERTHNSQFHFDLEERSQSNFLEIFYKFRYIFRKNEQFEEWKLAREKVKLMIKEQNHHFKELNTFLREWDLSFISKVQDVLILHLKNNQDANMASSLLHYAKRNNEYLNELRAFTTLKEVRRVKEFFEINNMHNFFIGRGPRMMIFLRR